MTREVKYLIISLLTLIPALLNAQGHSKGYGSKNYMHYRNEWDIGVGVSNYLGELGGADKSGGKLDPSHTEPSQFKFALSFAYRYNFNRRFAVRPQLLFAKVSGNDQLTAQPERQYRNLKFSSNITEFGVYGEYHFIRADYGHGYYKSGVIGQIGKRMNLSAHLGLAFFFYNPKVGSVSLRELGTEGQGLPGGPKPYKSTALALPVGVNAGFMVLKWMRIGLDITYRWTTTDYLDDASTVYYDKEEIRKANGDLAAEMSDRTDGTQPWANPGAPRGNPKSKDSYFTMQIVTTFTPFHRAYGMRQTRTRAKF